MMNAEQKQAARNLIDDFKDAGNEWDEAAVASRMAALLQELIDAPEPVPVAWRYEDAFGTHFTEDYSEISNIPGALSFTALYAAPPHQSEHHLEMVNTPAPSVPKPVLVARIDTRENNLRCVDWEVPLQWLKHGTELYTVPPAPSVPDGWRSAIAKEFPLYDEDEIDEDKHCCEWVMLQERKRLHKMLAAAPTLAEAPAQDFEDALEQAFWDFDARHKGYKKTIRPISERDAFKQVLRNFMHEHGGAEAPADVAHELTISSLRKKLGLPEHCAERRILCAIDELIAGQVPADVARDAARYRWLLNQAWFQQAADRFDFTDGGMQIRFEKCMDEFIDAAMSGKGGA